MRQNVVLKYKMTGHYLPNPQIFHTKQAVQILYGGEIVQVKGMYIDAIDFVRFIDEDDFDYFGREVYADMSRRARTAREQPLPAGHHLCDLAETKKVGSIDHTFGGGADSNRVSNKQVIANRSLFATAAGLYGIAHPHIEVDDEIVFIYGLKVPLVVRLMSGHYRIIGPARVLWIHQPFRFQSA